VRQPQIVLADLSVRPGSGRPGRAVRPSGTSDGRSHA